MPALISLRGCPGLHADRRDQEAGAMVGKNRGRKRGRESVFPQAGNIDSRPLFLSITTLRGEIVTDHPKTFDRTASDQTKAAVTASE
jgi:hypothetical protein